MLKAVFLVVRLSGNEANVMLRPVNTIDIDAKSDYIQHSEFQ